MQLVVQNKETRNKETKETNDKIINKLPNIEHTHKKKNVKKNVKNKSKDGTNEKPINLLIEKTDVPLTTLMQQLPPVDIEPLTNEKLQHQIIQTEKNAVPIRKSSRIWVQLRPYIASHHWGLLIVLIACYFITRKPAQLATENNVYDYVAYGGLPLYDHVSQIGANLWRILTYSFIHATSLHLIGNCLFISIGWLVGRKTLRNDQLAAVYGTGIIMGAIGVLSLNFDTSLTLTEPIVLIGASGGAYALLACVSVFFSIKTKKTLISTANTLHFVPLLCVRFLFLACIIDALEYVNIYSSTVHLFGALSGFIFGFILRITCKKNKKP